MPRQDKRIVPMPPDFDEVQLTPEEEAYAIWDARCGKYFELKAEKQRQERLQLINDMKTPFTQRTLGEYVLRNNPGFVLDEFSRPLFNLLCQYFTGSPKFEESGHSLKKGLLLIGPVGVGKTEMLRVFSKNKRLPYHLLSVYEIERKCQEFGVEFYERYTGFIPGHGGTEEWLLQPNVGWAFDDLGRESVVFDFGNKSDVVSKIIQERYLNKERIPFNSLHITTNLTPDEIEKRYDYAVKSRLREMFNYIVVKGEDRRR